MKIARLKSSFVMLSLAVVVVVAGCGRKRFFVETGSGSSGAIPAGQRLNVPRGLAMFSGHTAAKLSWDDIRAAMKWADVIVVGEQHKDAVAHQVELALVSDAVGLTPPACVSMEMLERDEQDTVDAYLAGEISQAQFVKRTGSANWAAKGKWGDWYQPIVDAARDARMPVIAANSPREYVTTARKEGFGVLWAKPPAERKRYFIPRRILTGRYADQFMRMMSGHAAPRKKPKTKSVAKPTTRPATQPATTQPATTQPAKRRMPRRKIDPNAFFRAQLMWDATMAGSIAEGLDEGLGKVIHIVGQYHTDFDGGTVQYLLDLKPDLKILNISLQDAYARQLRPEDKDRADVVIYTQAAPKEDNKSDD
jgi:uncharacterized iron-regulated protein